MYHKTGGRKPALNHWLVWKPAINARTCLPGIARLTESRHNVPPIYGAIQRPHKRRFRSCNQRMLLPLLMNVSGLLGVLDATEYLLTRYWFTGQLLCALRGFSNIFISRFFPGANEGEVWLCGALPGFDWRNVPSSLGSASLLSV